MKGKKSHCFFTESLDLWHVAGLLTCLTRGSLPIKKQWLLSNVGEIHHKNLQQRELFLIFTGFPFNPLQAKPNAWRRYKKNSIL